MRSAPVERSPESTVPAQATRPPYFPRADSAREGQWTPPEVRVNSVTASFRFGAGAGLDAAACLLPGRSARDRGGSGSQPSRHAASCLRIRSSHGESVGSTPRPATRAATTDCVQRGPTRALRSNCGAPQAAGASYGARAERTAGTGVACGPSGRSQAQDEGHRRAGSRRGRGRPRRLYVALFARDVRESLRLTHMGDRSRLEAPCADTIPQGGGRPNHGSSARASSAIVRVSHSRVSRSNRGVRPRDRTTMRSLAFSSPQPDRRSLDQAPGPPPGNDRERAGG